MFNISPLITLCISVVLFIALFVIIYRQKACFTLIIKRLETQVCTQELLVNDLQSSLQISNTEISALQNKLDSQYLENDQVTKQLEHRIKTVNQRVSEQKQLIEQLQNHQPQDKLYSRAFKLVELGADIDEVVRECEIPLAEAEMLISIHRNKTTPS